MSCHVVWIVFLCCCVLEDPTSEFLHGLYLDGGLNSHRSCSLPPPAPSLMKDGLTNIILCAGVFMLMCLSTVWFHVGFLTLSVTCWTVWTTVCVCVCIWHACVRYVMFCVCACACEWVCVCLFLFMAFISLVSPLTLSPHLSHISIHTFFFYFVGFVNSTDLSVTPFKKLIRINQLCVRIDVRMIILTLCMWNSRSE